MAITQADCARYAAAYQDAEHDLDMALDERVAMQLAEEAAAELANANKQIEELRAKLEKFKAVLAD